MQLGPRLYLLIVAAVADNVSKSIYEDFNDFYKNLDDLSSDVFRGYDQAVSPVYTLRNMTLFDDARLVRAPVFNVTLLVDFFKLVEVVEAQEKVSVLLNMFMIWVDPRLTWHPADYGHIEWFYISADRVWVPPIVTYNTHEVDDYRDVTQRIVELGFRGNLTLGVPLKISSVCAMTVHNFPYDRLNCNVSFYAPFFYVQEIEMHTELFDGIWERSIKDLGNAEWTIRNLSCFATMEYYSDAYGAFQLVGFQFALSRNSMYYIYMVIIPAFVMNAVAILGIFLKDTDKMNRLMVGMTAIMTFMFLLTVIAVDVPKTQKIPLIGMHLIVDLAVTLASVITSSAIPVLLKRKCLQRINSGKLNKWYEVLALEKNLFRMSMGFYEAVNLANFVYMISRGS